MLTPILPLRVAVMSSRRSPGLSDLIGDGRRGTDFEIVCALTSETEFADADPLARAGIPLLVRPIREACRRRGVRLSDSSFRREFDAETAALLDAYRPDAVLLSSYLYILTEPMLAKFPSRIVNIHGSDLDRRDRAGRPLFIGLRAVRDAIFAGERVTRATAHLVTERLDDGPILARSEAFPVSPMVADAIADGAIDQLKAYAFAHQEWMIRRAWGPLLKASLEWLLPAVAGGDADVPEDPAMELAAAGAGSR